MSVQCYAKYVVPCHGLQVSIVAMQAVDAPRVEGKENLIRLLALEQSITIDADAQRNLQNLLARLCRRDKSKRRATNAHGSNDVQHLFRRLVAVSS